MLKASGNEDEDSRKASGGDDGDDVGDQEDGDDDDSAGKFGDAVAGDEHSASSCASSPGRQPNTAPPSAARKAPANTKPPASASESAQSVSASVSDADSVRYSEFGGCGFSLL